MQHPVAGAASASGVGPNFARALSVLLRIVSLFNVATVEGRAGTLSVSNILRSLAVVDLRVSQAESSDRS